MQYAAEFLGEKQWDLVSTIYCKNKLRRELHKRINSLTSTYLDHRTEFQI